jgi:hypothetical protein
MYDTYENMAELEDSDPGCRRQMMVFQGRLVVVADCQRVICANLQAHLFIKKAKTTPDGVNLKRSHVLYRAAQWLAITTLLA